MAGSSSAIVDRRAVAAARPNVIPRPSRGNRPPSTTQAGWNYAPYGLEGHCRKDQHDALGALIRQIFTAADGAAARRRPGRRDRSAPAAAAEDRVAAGGRRRRRPGVLRVPRRTPSQAAQHQPAGALQPRDRPTHRRRRHLPHRPLAHPPRVDARHRGQRRMARRTQLHQPRFDGGLSARHGPTEPSPPRTCCSGGSTEYERRARSTPPRLSLPRLYRQPSLRLLRLAPRPVGQADRRPTPPILKRQGDHRARRRVSASPTRRTPRLLAHVPGFDLQLGVQRGVDLEFARLQRPLQCAVASITRKAHCGDSRKRLGLSDARG